MARLGFGGLDFGHEHADGLIVTRSVWAAPTYDAATTRSGRGRSGKLVTTTAAGSLFWELTTAIPDSTGGYGRFWVNFPALPSVSVTLASWIGTSSATAWTISLSSAGVLSASFGTETTTLTAGSWHCIEMYNFRGPGGTGAGQGEWIGLRVNGVEIIAPRNVSASGTGSQRFRFGVVSSATPTSVWTAYFDDWAINDSTGATDNSWPGNTEKTVLLAPVSDNAVGADWKLGGGTAPSSNAFDSVDNVPPTGKAAPAAGDQLEDAVANISGGASQADLNLETYTSAGIGAGDTVRLVRAVAELAVSSATTPPSLALQLTSNPAEGAETVTTPPGSAVGAYPTNWKLAQNAIIVAPSVTLGSAPVLRLAKRTNAAATKLYVTAAGLYVAYEPAAGGGTTAALASTIAAVASATASLTGRGNLSASITAQAAVTATPTATGGLSTTIAAAGGVSGTLIPLGVGGMVSTIVVVSDLTATPQGQASLTAVIVAQAGVSGALSGGDLASTIAGQSGFTAVILAPAAVFAVGHGLGTGLFVELTTLHYPSDPARVLAVVQQYEGLEVTIPLNDARTAKVTLGIYDDAVFAPVAAALPGGLDDLPYMVMLRVRYHGLPVFWGPVTVPNWRGQEGKVTLNAVGPELRLQHHFLKDGDPTGDGPLDREGKFPMTTAGLRLLRDAAINEPSDDSHGVPDLGIIDGSSAILPPELAPVPRLPFKRHDEIWRAMQELRGHELAPDLEFAPVIDVPGAYARLNCYFPQGTDRTGAIRLYYGFGPGNLDDFTADPGGKLITRQTYVSSDDKIRKRATAWDSAAKRGIYGAVETTDYSSDGDSIGEALTLRAKLEVRKYREPLKQVGVRLKPEAAIDDELRRYRYGRDFFVGDIVHVEARKGWLRADLDARITKVTLRQVDRATVVPELELIPDIGDGTPETGEGE